MGQRQRERNKRDYERQTEVTEWDKEGKERKKERKKEGESEDW